MTDIRLFVGREDVFAEQQESGAYYPVLRPLSDDDLADHLAGHWTLGTYCINPADQTVKFVVFDLDSDDESLLDHLKEAVEFAVDPLCEGGSYECLMLEKSGMKGYHVWLFLGQPTQAWRIRRWLDERFWPMWNDRSDSLPLEVFPKQDRVREGGYGNLVKLPLGKHQRTGKFSEILVHTRWQTETDSIVGMDTSDIPTYEGQEPQTYDTAHGAKTGVLMTNGPVAKLLRGEVEAGERNSAFHAFFTWTAWNVHLPDDLAWSWWERLNEALPNPEDNEAEVRTTMESAYGRPPADAGKPRATLPHKVALRTDYSQTPWRERLAQRKAARTGVDA